MAQLVMTALMPQSDWRPTLVSELPQDWSEIRRICLDVETKDPDLRALGCGARREGCHIVGYGLGLDLGDGRYQGHYLPIRHEGGGNLPAEGVEHYVRDRLKDYRGKVVTSDGSYDLDFMAQAGVNLTADHPVTDVLTNDALIYEHHQSYTLDEVSKRNGLPGKNEAHLRMAAAFMEGGSKNPKGALHLLHSKHAGPYVLGDVTLPLEVDDRQIVELERQELEEAARLEAAVLPVTVAMRRVGVQIDQDALESVETWALMKQAAFCAQFRHLTGIAVDMDDLRSPLAMAKIVSRLGLPPLPMTRRFDKKQKKYVDGQPEIAAEVLKAYRDPRIDLLSDARKLDTIPTKYAPSTRKYMVNGRINGTLKSVRGSRDGDSDDQSGTVSGRFAHVHPNLGNQPNPQKDKDDALRVEMGTRWRSVFVPDGPLPKALMGRVRELSDGKWGLVDLSQQEPRGIVNDAEYLGLRGARIMGEAFRNDPSTDNHTMISMLTHLPRGPAKIVFLARCYGAGMAKIALQLEDKLRYLDDLLRTDPTHKDVRDLPTSWARLPPGWKPTYEATYTLDDWVPPHKCVGDTYDKADPICEAIIQQLDEYAPYVKQLARLAAKSAEGKGYILLWDGRRSRLERRHDGSYKDSHKALNKRAQGNGAVQLKLALVALARAGLLPQMSVHDDVSRTVYSLDELRRMKEIVENVVTYVHPSEYAESTLRYKSLVPWLAKIKVGDSYGTADSAEEIL
jgi:hypothetical protein